MPLSHIEHFLVAADDIDATRDWYARVLGMRSGPHPEFSFPVHWMYLGELDVVHIGTGAVDHIAFRATGLRQMMEHLKSEKIEFHQRRANGQALYQLFFLDPNGI